MVKCFYKDNFRLPEKRLILMENIFFRQPKSVFPKPKLFFGKQCGGISKAA